MKRSNYLILLGTIIAQVTAPLCGLPLAAPEKKICALVGVKPIILTSKEGIAQFAAMLCLTRGLADQWVIKKTTLGKPVTFDPSGTASGITINQDLAIDAGVQFTSVDRSTAGTLSLGTTNATTVTIGNTGSATMAVELPNGYITTGSNRYINNFGTASFFAGVNAGNTQALNAGTNNTGVGQNAGTAITDGTDNTFIGYAAGLNTTSGTTNICIGSNSGQGLTGTSAGNIAIGYLSLNNGPGDVSTAVGVQTLTNRTGSNNTALGYNAGSGAPGSTGNNNIYIGYQEQGPASESNVIRIGANATLAATKCYVGGIDGVSLGTQAKIVGVTSNQLGTTDASGFTLGGPITSALYADGGVDRSTAATLNLGTANATAISLGKAGTTTAVDIYSTATNIRPYNVGVAASELRFYNPAGTFYSGIKAGALGANTAPLVLPLDNGLANRILTTDGAGNTSWTTAGTAAGDFVNNGNSFGVPAVLGTTDIQPLSFITNNTTRMSLDTAGTLELVSGYITKGSTRYISSPGTTNFFAGISAGTTGVSGVDNTGIGNAALTAVAGGSYNTAVGSGALATLTTEMSNSAVGQGALASCNGKENCALGASALSVVAGGIRNTGIGVLAGDTLTNGSYNIYLGYLEAALAAGESNTIRIGSNATLAATRCFVGGIDGISLGAQAKIVGITSNQLGTTDASGFTLGGSLTTSSAIYADGGVDRSTAATLSVGTTNATTVTIGNTGSATMAVELPNGYVTTGGNRYINKFGTTSFFAGKNAGNTQALNAGTNNTGVGEGALFAVTTGIQNTAFGRAALQTLTTGQYNTAVGYQALVACDKATGGENTAVGAVAGTAITTGVQNVFVGNGTGATGTTSSRNVCVGYTAGYTSASFGNDNTAIGHKALFVAQTSELTAVGSNALAACTVGTQNTAVGFNALPNHASGNGNTALGHSALAASDLGTGNTALGFGALESANSATSLFNTAVGAGAGGVHTTGSYNTMLGYLTNPSITGSRNIIIGENSGSGYPGAESNNILINNAGVGAENNAIHIGTQGAGAGQQNKCFIAGITGAGPFANAVSINPLTGQLGDVVSSRRYKENIQPLDSQDRFMQLNPVSFNYKNDPTKSTWYGLIAEEVEPIYPELAVYGKDGQLDSVSYLKLDGILIKEIQRVIERSNSLEATNTALSAALQSALDRISALEAKLK